MDGSTPSAKLDELVYLVREALENGRRVLVFSAFVTMIKLIADRLRHEEVTLEQLTGETQDRAGAVRRFQEGNASVFLISLKTGGNGLNLTAADTVILYDPWWNPAVEAQAADRAHRIGQTKPVTVYRLVAEGTIEAKIHERQAEKLALAEGVLNGGDLEPLSLADLQALLLEDAAETPVGFVDPADG